MLKLVLFVVIVLVVLAVLLAIFVATRPAAFRFERKARIKAAPQKIYGLIQDFRNWRAWSPWEDLDPELKRTYSGQDAGVGSVYDWSGNNKAGVGRMEIIEANSPSKVVIALTFIKPFAARNTAEFTIEPAAEGAEVTWAMYGPNSTPAKIMSLFMSMDRMLGESFDQGLAKMKAAAEG